MSLKLARSKVLTPRLPISYWRLFPAAHACSAQPRTTSREWQGGPLRWSRFTSFKRWAHTLYATFLGYFLLLEGGIFFYQTLQPQKWCENNQQIEPRCGIQIVDVWIFWVVDHLLKIFIPFFCSRWQWFWYLEEDRYLQSEDWWWRWIINWLLINLWFPPTSPLSSLGTKSDYIHFIHLHPLSNIK